MVAFDNTILSLLIFPDADLRQGSSGQKVEYARERVLGLVQEIEDAREQVGHSDDVDQSFRFDADQIGAKRRRPLSV